MLLEKDKEKLIYKVVAALIELHYLPSVAYFATLYSYEKIIIEKHEHFVKQSYRNRCHLLTAQGIERLVIPLTSKSGKVLITEVRIDYSQKWLNNHWRTIESAYRNAPFFEHYADGLKDTLFRKHVFLYDLNMELLTICLTWLKSGITIQESLAYEKVPATGVLDMRSVIHAKNPQQYDRYFQSIPYTQVFGNTFAEGLSIIDLVFCEGPNARKVVMSSARPH